MAVFYEVQHFLAAKDLPASVWESFSSHPRGANIMHPHAKKCRLSEEAGDPPKVGQCWVVCSRKLGNGDPSVDFVLSCTEGLLGNYPIFIFTTIPHSQLNSGAAASGISALVDELSPLVAITRVFSVFAPEPLAQRFASAWAEKHGVPLDPLQPIYYRAKLTYCTKETLRPPRQGAPAPSGGPRRANQSDISTIAELCQAFAKDSHPFVLGPSQARQEAEYLVAQQQVWVHTISTEDVEEDIACIVAVTRTSETAAAITKVFTNEKWRKRGCAERLVREVCQELLETRTYVVLYVGHDNSAAKVYDKVGFVGLNRQNQDNASDAEDWLELGFDRKRVTLGHW